MHNHRVEYTPFAIPSPTLDKKESAVARGGVSKTGLGLVYVPDLKTLKSDRRPYAQGRRQLVPRI
ncbi:hypothetical protein M378DRAFT_171202 [Amanita muscaria Koide BX008]|uniref:Uncharacterized protein n=1 Tax=Amanita muscaria (strain Koide BX008) TaxID=946122 RepID=A0A0C2WNT7_AMAMK|nr:hypothetical protein M378DRAFT_171202 [Amanita muscaria Koide BX008]